MGRSSLGCNACIAFVLFHPDRIPLVVSNRSKVTALFVICLKKGDVCLTSRRWPASVAISISDRGRWVRGKTSIGKRREYSSYFWIRTFREDKTSGTGHRSGCRRLSPNIFILPFVSEQVDRTSVSSYYMEGSEGQHWLSLHPRPFYVLECELTSL